MIGKTISHYRIVEKLGEGGMGVVYVAEDTVLGRRVAIKTLTVKPGQNEQHFRTRFLREARAVSALSHPHIATIHDYGETTDGEPFIVMELVKGQTLNELMLGESLTIARAIQVIREVAEALAEAHRNGVIHRDIKPSNVAINHRGEVKVLDFGLAKQLNLDSLTTTDPERQTLLTSQTQEGTIIGTPLYLSPEQALGIEVDQRSDIFTLGTLLYECVAGRPPFDGATRMDICTKVIRDNPPPPSQFNPDVPQQLDQIALKALQKKPEARYQNAEEMLIDLRSLQGDLQASSMDHTVTRLVSHAEGTRATGTLAALSDIFRRPRISVGYVVAGVVLVGLIGLLTWQLTKATPYEPKPEAKRLYDLAVNGLREGAFFKSSKILQQAIADDYGFALAHARLAEAWTELDFSDKAKDELIRANDLVPNRSVLVAADGLRLQAISDTLKRDFPAAVESYRKLSTTVPDNEKAFALVDLGRAYEKNEQLDKAIQSYQEATQRDSHYAAAFLRLGVALGRAQKYPEADAALDQASKLFDISNEVEGITEVLFQRGTILMHQGKLDEARVQFNQALDRSVALENKDQRIRTLQALSNTFIQSGDAEKALANSQQAMQLAQDNQMENLTTAGLIEIGNSYLIKGNFAEAEKNYNEALHLAQRYKGKFNEARALLALGSLRKQQDDPQGTRDYTQQALPFYQQGSYGKQMFVAYTNLGYAYIDLGDYPSAKKTFEELKKGAEQVGDWRSLAFAYDGLGYVALETERFPEAHIQFSEEYKIGKSTNAQITVGYAAHYRASANWRLGKYEDARADLGEALAIAAPAGQEPTKDLLADTLRSSAGMALSQRKFAEAATAAQKALDLAGAEYRVISIRAKAALGLANALSGQTAAGRKRCDEAVQAARAMHNPHLLSEALLALAEAALAAGDAQTAMASATEAQQLLATAKQSESEWRAFLIQARASEKLGDQQQARELAVKAESIRASLEQLWGSDNYKTYLARPDVDEALRQLGPLAGR
jgi:tetratricopeptide (TPR) repeat protein/predicted Ser/Thr protein kinase